MRASIAAVAVLAAGCSGDDDAGSPVLGVTESGVGTCLDFPEDVGAEISELPVVPCEVSHSHEIFAVVLTEGDVYPGFEALETEATAACLTEFEPYVGINAFDSELFYSWMVPTLTSWDREDDREIVCVVGNHNGAPLVGSVEGTQR